jgi:hypothetical protein
MRRAPGLGSTTSMYHVRPMWSGLVLTGAGIGAEEIEQLGGRWIEGPTLSKRSMMVAALVSAAAWRPFLRSIDLRCRTRWWSHCLQRASLASLRAGRLSELGRSRLPLSGRGIEAPAGRVDNAVCPRMDGCSACNPVSAN